MKTVSLFLSLFTLASTVFAAKLDLTQLTLKEVSYKALEYALGTQKTLKDRYYVPGEYPTLIESTLVPVLVGVGKPIGKNQEASGFTTAAVINVLAQTYLDHPELKNEYPMSQIPGSLAAGVKTMERYGSGSTFNFYPARMNKGVSVRRPINMTLLPIWHGFTNIPNDADTTSSVIASKLFNAKINGGDYEISNASLNEITKYRDIDRAPQFYNKRNKVINSGAFMTWLYDEKNTAMPRFYFSSSALGERIPFNKNDVDCVVNANVLRMAALAGKSDLVGREATCSMLNELIQKDEHKDCGIYYPNTMNLAYALAATEKAGESCITQDSKSLMIKKILAMQNAEGAWLNEGNVWQDPTITTAFALSSLLQYANRRDPMVHQALVYGVHYLLKNAHQKNGQIYWDADHYFTATAIARSLIMWSSPAYTNAIIANVLLSMAKEFPNYSTAQYLNLNVSEKP